MDNTDQLEHTVRFRVLELYAGIGGMHAALKEAGIDFEIAQAIEINPLVLSTYNFNFKHKMAVPRNVESLSADDINRLEINVIVMSPPCQPFCRTGNKLDIEDQRSSSLEHLLNILPDVNFDYLLVENVKGFETSVARQALIETLGACKMTWQEFLLTPISVGVPNSRLRYYLLAKKCNLKWCFEVTAEILTSVPFWETKETSPYRNIITGHNESWKEFQRKWAGDDVTPSVLPVEWMVGHILEDVNTNEYLVPTALLSKYGIAMDIVDANSKSTNCFTKAYGNFIKGTGSYLAQSIPDEVSPLKLEDENITDKLIKMKLRYFTPREIARLMCYPDKFKFPPNLSVKQQYRALGNSVNVYVVSILMSLLLTNSM